MSPSKPLPGQMLLPVTPPSIDATLAAHVENDWQERAACARLHGDVFYPDEDATPDLVRAAKHICAGCPVLTSCRAAGLLGDEHGIWGGLSETDRDDLRADLSNGVPVAAVLHPTYRTTPHAHTWKETA